LGGGWTDFFQEVKLLKARTRSIKRIAGRVIKNVDGIFNPAPNSKYKAHDLMRTLIEICIKNDSTERCSMPSSDTMLRRLHQVNEGILERVIGESNVWLLKRLCLRRRVMLAIDYRTLPYYGDEQPALVSDSRLPGTRLGIRFATLSIVEAGRKKAFSHASKANRADKEAL